MGARTVGLVGFGYVGSCLGAVLAERGCEVVTVDARAEVLRALTEGRVLVHEPGLDALVATVTASKHLRAATKLDELATCDVLVVTVGTPLSAEGSADLGAVVAAARDIAKVLRRGHLVLFKSTLPPGATDDVLRAELEVSGLLAERDFFLAFCPERLAEGQALADLRAHKVVVGGVGPESARRAGAFFKDALGVEVLTVGSAKAAELSKLADNLWIDLNIALANEVALLSEKLGVDALEVIAAANTLPKGASQVNILRPSFGVGGACLTKDPWFVHAAGARHGLDLKTPVASRGANDAMPLYAAASILRAITGAGRAARGAPVAVLGIAFKANTGDCRNTPARALLTALGEAGCDLRVYDPLVTAEDAKLVTTAPLMNDVRDAVRGATCVAYLARHNALAPLAAEELASLAPGCLVYDGRNAFSRTEIDAFVGAGLTYRGVGR